MVNWKMFGVSVIGPGHVRAGFPNQDAFAASESSQHDCLVVSDGVGSAARSDIGSRMVCAAVREAMERLVSDGRSFDAATFVMDVKDGFLRKISPMTSRECAATCLFAMRHAGCLSVGLLGDGVVAVQKSDGAMEILCDDKAGSFSNMVAALSEETRPEEWKTLVLPESACRAVVLCTDGVGDDLKDVSGFMSGLVGEYATKDVSASVREIRSMLENWPTPKHTDDKTIACMFRKEASHGGV